MVGVSGPCSQHFEDIIIRRRGGGAGRGGRQGRSSSRGRSQRDGDTGRGSVLLYGNLRELALYRAEVLRHMGFSVIIPRTHAETVAAIQHGGFDVAVLSYTLPSDTVEELAELLRQQRPECPLICISQSGILDPRIRPEELVLAEEGPPALILALQRALRRRTQ